MRLEYAFLADAGHTQADGLFSVINGGVDIIHCSQFPGGLHAIHLIARVSFEPYTECGNTILINMEIVSPGDEIIEPSFRNVPIRTTPNQFGADRRCMITLSFTFRTITFPAPGTYYFRISHSDASLGEVGSVPVDVVQS
jgi:hypothetical protein